MRRAVLDPNVFVSAYISPKGAPAPLFELALSGRLQLVVSPQLLAELEGVLRHARTLERYRDPARVEAFLAAIQVRAQRYADQADPPPVSRDASDDYRVLLAHQ